MPMRFVTQAELIDLFERLPPNQDFRGLDMGHEVELITATRPKLNKKHRETGAPCPWPAGIVRLAVRRAIIGKAYQIAVNDQRVAEGKTPDFNPETLWKGRGQRHGRCTVSHRDTGHIYLACEPRTVNDESETGSHAVVEQGEYRNALDMAEIIPNRDVEGYLPPKGKTEAQGLDHDRQWRCFKMDSIWEIELPIYGRCRVVQNPAQQMAAG